MQPPGQVRTHISIHAPAKGATFVTLSKAPNISGFQSTLPRRERPCAATGASAHAHFNPRSREGSDVVLINSIPLEMISIHAPAKGATMVDIDFISRILISIHAPAKGATLQPYKWQQGCSAFQSTLPRRERPPFAFEKCLQSGISIHAPAKGATNNRQD